MITTAKIKKALESEGLFNIEIERERDYFWLWSKDEDVNDILCSASHTGIYVGKLSDLTVESWVREVKAIFEEGKANANDIDLDAVIRVRG